MPVITCFYCSSYATEEQPLHIDGDEVLLRLCRKHAKSNAQHQRAVPAPPPAPVAAPAPSRPRGFRLMRSRPAE